MRYNKCRWEFNSSGVSSEPLKGSFPFVVKFNPDGSVHSKLKITGFPYSPTPVALEPIHDSVGNAKGYIIALSYIQQTIIARFNNYGKVIWSKVIHIFPHLGGKFLQPAYNPITNKLNGFYLLIDAGDRKRLFKLSIDGNILWEKRLQYVGDDADNFSRGYYC